MIPMMMALLAQATTTYTTKDGGLSLDIPASWSRLAEREKGTAPEYVFQGPACAITVKYISLRSTSARDAASVVAENNKLKSTTDLTPPEIPGADTHFLMGSPSADDPGNALMIYIWVAVKNGICYVIEGAAPLAGIEEAGWLDKIFKSIRLGDTEPTEPEEPSDPGNPADVPSYWKVHTNSVRCIAVRPDGKRVLSASGDGTIQVWDIEAQSVMAPLTGHQAGVNSVVFLPDGKRALSASNDKTLKLWYVETGKEMATWTGHTNFVHSVAVSPDGKLAVSGSQDKTIRLWEVRTGKSIATWIGHRDSVNAVAFRSDGKRVLSASNDGTLKLWDVESGKEVATCKGHSGFITSVAFHPDGKRALSGGFDNTLKLWEVETGQCLATWSGPTDAVTCVAFDPRGDRAASGGHDDLVRIWDVATGQVTASRKIVSEKPENWIECVAFSPDGLQVTCGILDGSIQAWVLPRTLDLGGGVKMEFVPIKAGKFVMGDRGLKDATPHEVTLTRGYWMQTTETTQAQWEAVMGTNPSLSKGPDRPVECVTWDACQEFLRRLNEKVKDQLWGSTAALPTEAQWEYACRAGYRGKWGFKSANNLEEYAWYLGTESHPVGQKKPNGWGLYDMHGNVTEWCEDWYENPYPSGAVVDPTGPAEGKERCLRGGCFGDQTKFTPSAVRQSLRPGLHVGTIGLRVVLR